MRIPADSPCLQYLNIFIQCVHAFCNVILAANRKGEIATIFSMVSSEIGSISVIPQFQKYGCTRSATGTADSSAPRKTPDREFHLHETPMKRPLSNGVTPSTETPTAANCAISPRISSDSALPISVRDTAAKSAMAMLDGGEIDEGLPVFGYCPWSFIDVVSSHQGFAKRYGFVYVDRTDTDPKQCARIKKDSFTWYQQVIKNNGLPDEETE